MHCLRGASAGKSQKVLVVQQAERAFCLRGTQGGKPPRSGYRSEEIQEIKASPIRRVSGMTVANVVQPFLFSGTQLRNDWPFGNLRPNGYDLIMADPPWRFGLWSSKGEEKSPQAHYHTMSIPEIKALPVAELAAADCLLWLWATAPMLPQSFEIMAAWGFRYATMGGWHKTTPGGKTAFGTGYVMRSAFEPFVIGKRGNPKTTRSVRNLVVGQVREHSRKPEEAYAAAEALMPGAARAELFSRTDRPGWSAWGDEAGKFSA